MTASVPKLQVGTIPAYAPTLVPVIPGGNEAFTLNELQNLGDTVAKLVLMCPQSATALPKKLKDGMIRLARDPWWPVSGQTADAWVYWDAAGQVWRLLSTAPTTT